jgi:hypothetical protein
LALRGGGVGAVGWLGRLTSRRARWLWLRLRRRQKSCEGLSREWECQGLGREWGCRGLGR